MIEIKIPAKGKNQPERIEKFYPEEISSKLLENLKTGAQNIAGKDREVKNCVITVPAYFNDSQK